MKDEIKHYEENETLKVLLIGNAEVGKSALLKLFVSGISPSEDYRRTIGMEFAGKVISHNNKDIRLKIWDSASDERFRTITSSYFRGAKIILLFYDVTENVTLEESLKNWIAEINTYSAKNCIKILVGNKSGEKNSNEFITEEAANKFALKNRFHAACGLA